MPIAAEQIDLVEHDETIVEGCDPEMCQPACGCVQRFLTLQTELQHNAWNSNGTQITRKFTYFGSSRTNAAAAVSATELADMGAEAAACVEIGGGTEEREAV